MPISGTRHLGEIHTLRYLCPGKKFRTRTMPQINTTRLPNGLTLVHTQDTTTQMVATSVLYRVGAANEEPDHTGLAHLLEHLMFGGSENAPDFDKPLQQACGENNAFTNADRTHYYITLPAVNVETAFWLESDRMTRLVLTPRTLEVQRNVVMEEFKLHYINRPFGDLQHLLYKLVYEEGAYSWPTIGLHLSHIEEVSLQTVQDFYRRFYAPSNAILSVCGNISWERTQELTERWFGPLVSSAPAPPPPAYSTSETHSTRRLTVHRAVPNDVLIIAWRTPNVFDPRIPAFDLASDLLVSGKSSRLYRSLVEQQRAALGVEAYIEPALGPGLFIVEALPAPGVSTEHLETAVREQVEQLLAQPPSEQELEKVLNRLETALAARRSSCHDVAMQLAWCVLLGDAELFNTELSRYRSVTPESLHHAVADTLSWQHANVLHYKRQT